MSDIYDQHKAAFNNVAAYVVMRDIERVATIAFKFPKDGAGRLYVYVHWIGLEMVRGHASGYGYDKRSAAIESAIKAMCKKVTPTDSWPFTNALSDIGGSNWETELRRAGFTVFQAV